jgi:CubicO group peptidase (beta-lactamase class C family)
MNELSQQLNSILEAVLPGEYTSVSYAIALDGQIIAADALGSQGGPEKKPATADCAYNVASISKIFCTAAVMQLVERGLLDLDRPVCDYLPRFRMRDPLYRQITLRHCLSHSSGLPGTQWRGFSVSDTSGADYYDDVYDFLSKSTLKAAPGTYSVYCNDGFTLAEMAVAQVTGMDYAAYCRENIFRPLGLESAGFSEKRDSRHPLVHEGEKPAELLLIRGAAGLSISMPDLCRFGQIFLDDSPVLSRKSKDEMAKPQGRTFLKTDGRAGSYGLGWDVVDFLLPYYSLGSHALYKGGNSFQFSSGFLIVPECRAVCAISHTHDCSLDTQALLVRLLSEAFLACRGRSLSTRNKPIPEKMRPLAGTYLTQGGALNLRLHGETADLTWEFADGKKSAFCPSMYWDGGKLCCTSGERSFSFEKAMDETFLMSQFNGRCIPIAQKARPLPGSEAWNTRLGRSYLVCDADPTDLVIGEDMTGFRLAALKGTPGVWLLSFVQKDDSGVYSRFDGPVRAVDSSNGKGFLLTPANPSRDSLDPRFFTKEGIEYCETASYTYRDTASLPVYAGQQFPSERRRNGLYRFDGLAELPVIPEKHRIIVLNGDLQVLFDSLFTSAEKFQPVRQNGYLILI